MKKQTSVRTISPAAACTLFVRVWSVDTRLGAFAAGFIEETEELCAFVPLQGIMTPLQAVESRLPQVMATVGLETMPPMNPVEGLCLIGTPFQIQVWRTLMKENRKMSYGELAMKIGNPQAAQAVGNALARNPLAYYIPCHLVIGKHNPDAFAWGSDLKHCLQSLHKV